MLLQVLHQERYLGQVWLWEDNLVLTGRREGNVHQGLPQGRKLSSIFQLSHNSQAGKNSWESRWDKNSCGQGSSPAWTGRKSRSWLRATCEVSIREPDLHSELDLFLHP